MQQVAVCESMAHDVQVLEDSLKEEEITYIWTHLCRDFRTLVQ